MDLQFNFITENLTSPTELLLFCIPILIHGIVHWIRLTDKNPHEIKTLIILLPSMFCFFYFIAQGKWQLSFVMLGTNKIGKITVTPFLDLFWSYYHFGNPFKCFFLSKERRLGPSQKAINNEEAKIYGLNLRYGVPERNIHSESSRTYYGEVDRKLTQRLKFPVHISEIKRWKKYQWSTEAKRYLVGYDYTRYHTRFNIVEMTICEATFDEKKCSSYDAILEVIVGHVFECGSHHIYEDAQFQIENIEVRHRALGNQDAVLITVKSDLIYDHFSHFVLFKSGRDKIVFFEVGDDNQYSGSIAELIFSTLQVHPTKKANAQLEELAQNHDLIRDANCLLDRFAEKLIQQRKEEERKEKIDQEQYEKWLKEFESLHGVKL
ncbi:hypothetical protein M0G74_12640 [Microbulbifer sp. CAU 1566]|uniref:hypothetical protein n=1 Tax=Microbulbifer sp. CAU 1566 TaxID=2933269 RepID=UPI002004A665|nr:hypothetical protein [Microbulbifer sp. CAU 1566]MCK7598122.1 hypothetical protein [Microbulbifer sp. CAU 1566]